MHNKINQNTKTKDLELFTNNKKAKLNPLHSLRVHTTHQNKNEQVELIP